MSTMTTQATLSIPKKGIAKRAKSPEDSGRNGETRGGMHNGVCYALSQIDPNTLPDENTDQYWHEVRRRVLAYDEGIDGWETGDFGEEEADLAEWGVDR